MRNIATCYSEHAVRVSDSYCSGPLKKSYINPNSTLSIQNIVSCTYKAQISNKRHLYITITWCNKLICQGFFIKISENNQNNYQYQHGFYQIPKVKGTKTLQDFKDNKLNLSVHWDLSRAEFEAGPNPLKGYYIIILLDSSFCVILGDIMENDPIVKNIVHGSTIVCKVNLTCQCEHFTGKWVNNQIISNAKFCDHGDEHEIMIKFGLEEDGPRSPVLSVYIDKKRVVKVKRLQWNFRGNQMVFVDGLLVDVMWDVNGWYFVQTNSNNNDSDNDNDNRCGIFMFRIRSGLDSRLWLEEQERNLGNTNYDKPEFSLLICASEKNTG